MAQFAINNHHTQLIVDTCQIMQEKIDSMIQNHNFTLAQIIDNFKLFTDIYEVKKEEALHANKKLLILLGESHQTGTSLFYEMLILTYLKSQGFNSLLIETDEQTLEELRETNYNSYINYGGKFAVKALEMALIATDSLHKNFESNPQGKGRMEAINKEIAKHNETDQVGIYGHFHLKHISDAEEIKNEFIILPVDVTDNAHSFDKYRNLQDRIREALYDSSDDYNPDNVEGLVSFSPLNLEPFTIEQLIQMYNKTIDTIIDPTLYMNHSFTNSLEELDKCEFLHGKSLIYYKTYFSALEQKYSQQLYHDEL
jgi:hypothetical protein